MESLANLIGANVDSPKEVCPKRNAEIHILHAHLIDIEISIHRRHRGPKTVRL